MSFFFKKPRKKATRLFFATDLHGSERTFRKFINAGKFYEADVLVMGGDITGKLLIPIIKEGNGHFRATLQGNMQKIETEAELQQLQERIGILGFYSQIMEGDEFHQMQADAVAVDKLFRDLARQRLDDWVDLAETRLAGTGIKCFVTGGNDDDPDTLEPLYRKGTQSFFGCENEMVYVDDEHSMVSVGYSAPTPWKTPREVSDEELGRVIEEMVGQVPDMGKCIFNFHDQPLDSTLDTCPSRSLKPGRLYCTAQAASLCVKPSKNTNPCWGCTVTSTNRNRWRRSVAQPASTRAVSMAKVCCAAAW